MSTPTPADERRERIRRTFDALAARYDGLRFTQVIARRMAALAPIAPGARVLDIATGTGLVAALAAARAGPGGEVTGVDLSAEMLARARANWDNARAGLAGPEGEARVQFRQGDATHLPDPDGSFDTVLCASSLFFFPDPLAAARECLRVLKPGGAFWFSSFGADFLEPLNSLWSAALERRGIRLPRMNHLSMAEPETCAALLRSAGFARAGASIEDLSYFHATPEDRWTEIETGLEGLPLANLSETERAEIRAEHLSALAAYRTDRGIRLNVPAIFAYGERAGFML